MRNEFQCKGSFIDGRFLRVEEPNGELVDENPADLSIPALKIPYSYQHVQLAVEVARRSFRSWKKMPMADRVRAFSRYAECLQTKKETLAYVMAWETGKPLWECRREVDECLMLISFFLQELKNENLQFEVLKDKKEVLGRVRHLARGVCAVLTPASQPLLTSHHFFIPSVLFGNSIVIKSPKYAPLSGQLIAEVLQEAQIPAGVVNVICGETEVGRRLAAHKDIDVVFFSGSYERALKLKKLTLSDHHKTIVTESGAKNSLVVFADCQYEKALYDAFVSAYMSSGQRSTSARCLLVHESLFEKFLADFHTLSKKCLIGNGVTDAKPVPFMGPLINEKSMENYLSYQGIAIREGCDEVMRGKALERDKKGYYVSPSIHVVKEANRKSLYQRDETLGPNVAFYKIRDVENVMEILDMVQGGLVTSIYTQDARNFEKMSETVRVGFLHQNERTIAPTYRLAAGGIDRAGNYRPMGAFAKYQCTFPLGTLEQSNEKSNHLGDVPLPQL